MAKMFTKGFRPKSTTKEAKKNIRSERTYFFIRRNIGVPYTTTYSKVRYI